MLSEVLSRLTASFEDLSPWKSLACSAGLLLLCLSIFQYAITAARFPLYVDAPGQQKKPPLVPHIAPFLGTLPLTFLWNPMHFVISSKTLFWSPHPVRVKFMGLECYIVSGAANIKSLFKAPSVTAFGFHGSFLRKAFGMSEKAAVRYSEDDSGENPEPAPNSNVEPKNRMNYLTHEFFKRFLSGPTLQTLEKELENHLTGHLLSLSVATDSGWTHIHDFMSIFKTQLTSAVVDTICGPNLIRQNPGFPNDLWTVDCGVGKLMSGLPSFLVSKPRSCRARAVQSIKRWRAWAEENSDPAQVGPGGETPYWGTEMFHSLLEIYSNMDGFDDESVATEVLAFIWAATTNSVPLAFWACMDVFRDPELLAQVRSEVESCLIRERSPTDVIRFDTERLTRQPTLQAVFAETLRLRVHGFLMRFPSKENVIINHDWSIPRDSMILMSSTPGHMNPEVWASGSCESHPVDQFHPGRFLQYSEKTKSLAFSMARAKGHWTPFGGGHHPCPGRHFSRLEILLTIALLVTSYDCEILASEKSMKMSSQNFGFGVLDPCGEIPVRIRRRSMV